MNKLKTTSQLRREKLYANIEKTYTDLRKAGTAKSLAYDETAIICDTSVGTVQRVTKNLPL